jgi:hypothetical protein
MTSKLAADVDTALDPRKTLREREVAIRRLNQEYGRAAVTAELWRATRRKQT